MTTNNFEEFHRLIEQATRLIEQLPLDKSDPKLLKKQIHALQALNDSQKQALHLEALLKPKP